VYNLHHRRPRSSREHTQVLRADIAGGKHGAARIDRPVTRLEHYVAAIFRLQRKRAEINPILKRRGDIVCMLEMPALPVADFDSRLQT